MPVGGMRYLRYEAFMTISHEEEVLPNAGVG
jgi:hypothetical protein